MGPVVFIQTGFQFAVNIPMIGVKWMNQRTSTLSYTLKVMQSYLITVKSVLKPGINDIWQKNLTAI